MQITLHTPESIYSRRHLPSWLLLAGASGCVNGYAFLACEQFVTHVTGTVTRMGLEFFTWELHLAFAIVFTSFVIGAVVAFLMIQLRARKGCQDRWVYPLIVVVFVQIVVAVAGHAGALGKFGSRVASDPPPVVFLSLLAFASGLQNSSVASITGMAVRTTHLTGPTTDIGLLLGVAMLGEGVQRRAALRGAALRAGIVLAFLLGAGLAVPLVNELTYLAVLAPAFAVLVAAALSFVPRWDHPDAPFREADDPNPPSGINHGLPADARPQKFDEE